MKDKWKILESQDILVSKYIRIRVDKCELPDGRVMPKYYVVEFPDWVQVVALTDDHKMIMVQQYRHAADGFFLELPGGTADPHEKGNNLEAAKRELLEETGYEPDKIIKIGSHRPNPALQNNSNDVFLATGCKKVKSPSLDPFEDLTVELLLVKEVYEKLFQGKIEHSLMIAGLCLAQPHLKNWI